MGKSSANIFWLTFSRIASLAMLFFAYTQLFRYLGPVGAGQHQFILSFAAIFGIIIDFGIQQYAIKQISADPADAKKYFQNFFAVQVFMSVLVYIALVAIAWSQGLDRTVFNGIVVAGLGTAVVGLSYPFLGVMSAFQSLKKVAVINFVSSLINTIFIFSTIFFERSIVFLVGNQLVFAIISFFLYYRYVREEFLQPDLLGALRKFKFSLVKDTFIAALPFAMLVGFSTLYNKLDVMLIKSFLGYEQTGLYTAAYKFFDLVIFFPAVVSHALYPVFNSLLVRKELAQARGVFEKYLRLMLATALPVGVGGSLLAHKIIEVIAGPDFSASAPVLAILVWAPVALFIYIVANSVVISQLTRFAVVITGINVVVNVVGNIILLPRIGIVGAAIMTVISECIQGIFYFYFIRKKIIKFSFFKYAWQPLLASAFMGVVIWFVRDANIIVSVCLGSFVYVFALLVLGFFKKDDLAFKKGIFNKQNL